MDQDDIKILAVIIVVALLATGLVIYGVGRAQERGREAQKMFSELNTTPADIPHPLFGQNNTHWYYYEIPHGIPDEKYDAPLNVTIPTYLMPSVAITPRPAFTPTPI